MDMTTGLVNQSLWSFVLLTTAVAALTVTILRLVTRWRRLAELSSALKQFPSPARHWFWGNIKEVGISMGAAGLGNHMKWARQYGHAFVLHLPRYLPKIELVHHSTAQTLLNTAEPKDQLYSFIKPWIGDGLLVSSGPKWARNRRLLTPAFHFDILKHYVPLFSDCAVDLTSKWKRLIESGDCGSFEMFRHLSLVTLDSLLKCIFGVHSHCQHSLEQHPYIKAVLELSNLTVDRVRFIPYHINFIFQLSRCGYRFRQACKAAHRYSLQVIGERKTERASNDGQSTNKVYTDFLDILLDARDEDGNGLTDKEIQQEVDTFMFEGHDTTASGLSWCLYNLACNPDCQEKCRQEINEVLEDRNDVAWSDVHRLTYLTQCLKESLRLNPPVPAIGRQPTRSLTLPDGKVIPAGAWAGAHILTCHRDPSVWDKPDEFIPERFSLENSRTRPSHAFIPFSAGPRNCIGQHFAMLEMKTVLAILLKNFIFETDPLKPPIEMIPILTLRSKNGIWLRVRPSS